MASAKHPRPYRDEISEVLGELPDLACESFTLLPRRFLRPEIPFCFDALYQSRQRDTRVEERCGENPKIIIKKGSRNLFELNPVNDMLEVPDEDFL